MNQEEQIDIIIGDSSVPALLDSVLEIRKVVFMEEQNVPEEREIDGLDKCSLHILLKCGNSNSGCARFRIEEGIMKIERLAVLKKYRNMGFARLIMIKAMGYGSKEGAISFKIHAQKYLENYYRTFGFISQGEDFMDAGIPHIEMTMDNQ